PQIYVGWPRRAAVYEPVRQLRGFAKRWLAAGRRTRVTITLDPLAFSYWSVADGRWAMQPGCYPVYLGHSSRNVVASGRIAVGRASC
ncbi:MAG TPA: fibronectin type III-like domain-contianing protein, partial [Marmoricola sp.]|nr:fibronectin type III-like domain-contianing protein [Marmoricola sp.]